jgi:membrane-bound inhibitor of C-type lysozyme
MVACKPPKEQGVDEPLQSRGEMRPFAAAAMLLVLAACDRPATSPPVAASAEATAAPAAPVNPVVTVTTYACPGGESLQAAYPDRETAIVTWKGHTYSLKIARSGSGARYTGYGLQWWTKGLNRGTIATLKPGEDVASDRGVECLAPEATPVSPPEPGTPGGLPKDKTPISEAPFTPASGQGAANVVQRYFALMEQARVEEAAKLRSDGKAEDLTPFASYHAQIGGPGAIGAAAGSLFVEVPVLLYGRLKTGAEFHLSGKAVLRRVNEVPGSTAEQRKWRIERLELAG